MVEKKRSPIGSNRGAGNGRKTANEIRFGAGSAQQKGRVPGAVTVPRMLAESGKKKSIGGPTVAKRPGSIGGSTTAPRPGQKGPFIGATRGPFIAGASNAKLQKSAGGGSSTNSRKRVTTGGEKLTTSEWQKERQTFNSRGGRQRGLKKIAEKLKKK